MIFIWVFINMIFIWIFINVIFLWVFISSTKYIFIFVSYILNFRTKNSVSMDRVTIINVFSHGLHAHQIIYEISKNKL
jgi:hypothetical protein